MEKSKLPPGTRVRTEDGYTLTVQPDGSVGDGDLSFESLEDLAESVAFTVIDEDGTPKSDAGHTIRPPG